MSESSKVKAWAAKNGVKLEQKSNEVRTAFVLILTAPKGKCFVASDAHTLEVETGNASDAWKAILRDIRAGLEECPVVCDCRPTGATPPVEQDDDTGEGNDDDDEAVPAPRLEGATVTPPPTLPPVNALHPTREGWLTTLADKLRPDLLVAGGTVPPSLRVACGWPSKGAFSSKTRTIGECWSPKASAAGHTEIFISPYLATGLDAAETLAHELVHATGAMGHTGPFKRVAVALGLEGSMKATKAGERLKARLNELIADLGPYPHASLDKNMRPHKKDGTRLLKVVCPEPECGYVIRTTAKWIEVGFPTCPCGSLMGMAE